MSGRAKPEALEERLAPGQLFFLLHHLVRQRESALGDVLAPVGLSLLQWQVMSTLNRLERATMGDVAAFCAADRTTLTRTVDKMVDADLIQRERDRVDRRQVHLVLTPTGRERFLQGLDAVEPFNRRVSRVIRPEEMAVVQGMIRRVLDDVLDDPDWVEDLMAFRRMKTAPRPSVAKPA
jgi:DNA-binding MarR family transcriptional regulator